MRQAILVAVLPLWFVLGFPGNAAMAQSCDNLVGKEMKVAGTIDKMVESAGVVFFRDKTTSCQFGHVTHRNDKGCKPGREIEVSGILIANKFLPGTYDIDRGSKAPATTLVCR
jgi:hypothetical protein